MGIQTERVRAILFDIDGTLSDSDDLMVQKTRKVFKTVLLIFHDRKTAFCGSLAGHGN